MCRLPGLFTIIGLFMSVTVAVLVALTPATDASLSPRTQQVSRSDRPMFDILTARGLIPPAFLHQRSPAYGESRSLHQLSHDSPLNTYDEIGSRMLGFGEEDREVSPSRRRSGLETAMVPLPRAVAPRR